LAQVRSIAQSVRDFTGGQDRFDIAAGNLRELLATLEARYPGIEEHLRTAMSVAVDGELHPDGWNLPLRRDAEVVFIPLIAGG